MEHVMTRPEPSSDLAADDTRTTGTDTAGPAGATAATAGEAESRPHGQESDTGPATDPHGQSAIDADEAESPESRDEEPPQRPITSAARRTGKVRKARLRLLRVEPWSVMKTAFVLSIALGITFVVAVATLWSIIDAAGVFEAVGGLVNDLTESESASGVDVTEYVA